MAAALQNQCCVFAGLATGKAEDPFAQPGDERAEIVVPWRVIPRGRSADGVVGRDGTGYQEQHAVAYAGIGAASSPVSRGSTVR